MKNDFSDRLLIATAQDPFQSLRSLKRTFYELHFLRVSRVYHGSYVVVYGPSLI